MSEEDAPRHLVGAEAAGPVVMTEVQEFACHLCSFRVPYGGYNQTQGAALSKMLEHIRQEHNE